MLNNASKIGIMVMFTPRPWIFFLLPLVLLGCAAPQVNDTSISKAPDVSLPGLSSSTSNKNVQAESDPYANMSAEELLASGRVEVLGANHEEGKNKLVAAYDRGNVTAAYVLGLAIRDTIPNGDISRSIYWFNKAAEKSFEDS